MQESGFMKFPSETVSLPEGLFCLFSQGTEYLIPDLYPEFLSGCIVGRTGWWATRIDLSFLFSLLPFFFFFKCIWCWGIADLQCCDSFRWAAKGLSHTYTDGCTCIHSPPNSTPIQPATWHWAEFHVLMSLLVIHFKHSSVYMSSIHYSTVYNSQDTEAT